MTVSYSKDFDLATVADITDTDAAANLVNRQSKTLFIGDKGDEVADYSINFKKGTTDVRGVSINFYKKLSTTDLTGDGRNDLLILVHDRLILYPQDSAS